jgi:hypothetical protein
MFRTPLIIGAGLVLFSGTALAQTTVLTEDFNAGVVPPAGWTELNNGNSMGWEPDSGLTKAFHDDFNGLNDNHLMTPAMDLSLVTETYLHAIQDQVFASWRDQNLIDVSLDGGLTFTTVYTETLASSASAVPLEADMSAYAGMTGVQASFHYVGDFANEWYIDDMIVDDVAPPPPPPHWSNLPASFVSANAFRENFEAAAGVVPAYMALNALDSTTRLADPEAWCNIGQLAAPFDTYDGAYNLEMGLDPASTNYHDVSNAMILGLNGAGVTDFTMSFQAKDFGEEASPDDGVFVSADGLTWETVITDWDAILGGATEYTLVTCDLASTGVDVSGDFYVAVAQQDNFPYANLDGIGIDNVTVGSPVYMATNVVGGGVANLDVSGANPAGIVALVYSLTPGPTVTGWGIADVGTPYTMIGQYVPDALGNVNATLTVPVIAVGLTAWTQGLEVVGAAGRFTNGLVVTVL